MRFKRAQRDFTTLFEPILIVMRGVSFTQL